MLNFLYQSAIWFQKAKYKPSCINRHEDGILVYIYSTHDIIHLLYVGEGNMKIYSPKSIIFPEGNALGKYDTRGWINLEPACYECFIIPNETNKTNTCKILLANIL